MRDQLRSRQCAQRLKALSEPQRLKIVQCLQDGPKNVGELSGLLKASIANVSDHLRLLRQAKLVRDSKRGKFVLYSLDPEVFRPEAEGRNAGAFDFGCCRLELGGQ